MKLKPVVKKIIRRVMTPKYSPMEQVDTLYKLVTMSAVVGKPRAMTRLFDKEFIADDIRFAKIERNIRNQGEQHVQKN